MFALRRHILCGTAASLASLLALTGQCLVARRALAEDARNHTSAAFERFRYSFFEDPNSARDALDTRSLVPLEGEERSRAEDMLIAFLPDSRAVIGLGALRSRRAEPQLEKLFEDSVASNSRLGTIPTAAGIDSLCCISHARCG